jgi:hypothetical protein
MKYIHDVVSRFEVLKKMAGDPKVINEDGSVVDPFVEIAAEMFEVPKGRVTFDERNHAIGIINQAIRQQILKQNMSQQYNQNTAWSNFRK